jgi:hypothetical protein
MLSKFYLFITLLRRLDDPSLRLRSQSVGGVHNLRLHILRFRWPKHLEDSL